MSTVTVPTNPKNFTTYGDLDVLNAYSSDMGTGAVYIRTGDLYTGGLTHLNETTIITNDGQFTVNGSNLVSLNVTNAIQLSATAASYFNTTTSTLGFNASDTTAGKVTITGAGLGTNSVLITAPNATSGQVTISSAGDSAANPSINIIASGTAGGNVKITGSGNFTSSVPAVWLTAPHATGGKVLVESNSTATDSIWAKANNGGVKITGTSTILINTTDTTNGVVIASTSLVPTFIGSTGSLTTIRGELLVQGSTTTIDTISLTVEDNVVILNSGSAVAGIDAGIAIRRYQTPNDTPTGDVITTPNPIQESGAFQAGSATPGTLVLALHASAVNDYYVGWWVRITSGTAINTVRRIKTYVGSTRTATVYLTADNVAATPGPLFIDGLDLLAAPAAADLYKLYNSNYVSTFYNEATFKWQFFTVASPDINGITQALLQQPQDIATGAIDVVPKTYNNAKVTASGTALTLFLIGHGALVGDLVYLSNSLNLTPALASGNYYVITVPDADTFTVTAAASTTHTASSSLSVTPLKTSVIRVNVIEPYSPGIPIVIPGVTLVETITIPKTSTAYFTIVNTALYGNYFILAGDSTNFTGAYAIFSASSSQTGGSVTRISGSMGSDNQRLDVAWLTGEKAKIRHQPAGSGGGNYIYSVRVYSLL